MIRFGIIGCGNISRFHFNGIEMAGAKVTYIVDISEENAKPWVEKTGAKFSTNYMDLINSEEVDVVSVLAAAPFHKEMCLAALNAGKDVVCEKTMANTPEEAEEIAKASIASGRMFFTTYMKRFFPSVIKAKELMPNLGRVICMHARSYQYWGADFFTNPDENAAYSPSYGGAILKCAGSHILDMIMNFLGRPVSLYANVDCIKNTKFDRKVSSIMEYEDGVTAMFETVAHPLTHIGYEKNAWDERIEINCANGRLDLYTVKWDEAEKNASLLVYYNNETQTSTEYRFEAVNPFYIEIAEIVKAVETRKQIRPDVIDGFNVDVIIGAMKESSEQKKSVEINYKGL